LREASCGECQWPVEVLFDGERHTFLHTSSEKFSRAHSLEVGCLVNLKWDGDDELRVKVFDDTSYHRHYQDDISGGDEQKHHSLGFWMVFSLQRR
jgi:hypothetical protein